MFLKGLSAAVMNLKRLAAFLCLIFLAEILCRRHRRAHPDPRGRHPTLEPPGGRPLRRGRLKRRETPGYFNNPAASMSFLEALNERGYPIRQHIEEEGWGWRKATVIHLDLVQRDAEIERVFGVIDGLLQGRGLQLLRQRRDRRKEREHHYQDYELMHFRPFQKARPKLAYHAQATVAFRLF